MRVCTDHRPDPRPGPSLHVCDAGPTCYSPWFPPAYEPDVPVQVEQLLHTRSLKLTPIKSWHTNPKDPPVFTEDPGAELTLAAV